MDEITKTFLGNGVLGAVVIWLIWQLREARADVKSERAENKALTERLEQKGEKFAEKSQELAREVTRAFEAAIRSNEAAPTRQQPGPRRRNTLAKVEVDE